MPDERNFQLEADWQRVAGFKATEKALLDAIDCDHSSGRVLCWLHGCVLERKALVQGQEAHQKDA